MNNKISPAQTRAIIITAALGFEVLVLPMVIQSLLELVVILASGMVLCFIALYSEMDITKSRVLLFIYAVKNILVTILLTKILSDTISNVMLRDVLVYKIILITVLVSGYGALKGIEVIGRISQMLFWFVVIGTLYVYAMAVPDIDIVNTVGGNFTKRALLMGFIVNSAEIIIMLRPYMREADRSILKGSLWGTVLVFAVAFVIVGRLGIKGMRQTEYPFFEIIYTANLPELLIKRQEGIFISLWIISAFISIFVYLATAVEFMENININKKYALPVVMILVFVLASVFNGNIRAVRTYCFLQILGGLFTAFIIPLIYLFRRNKKIE